MVSEQRIHSWFTYHCCWSASWNSPFFICDLKFGGNSGEHWYDRSSWEKSKSSSVSSVIWHFRFNIDFSSLENQSIWRRSMILTLQAKSKSGFVFGTCKKSDYSATLVEQCEKCNAFVLSWILNLFRSNWWVESCTPMMRLLYGLT